MEESRRDQVLENPVETEETISDSFVCCVCLDLLHKPIVLPCGHIVCFWCVHKSMDFVRESHCPFCRHPYNHFPTICQMLYFVLLKMYPIASKRREDQILEEEKNTGNFSPLLNINACDSHTNQEYDCQRHLSCSSSTTKKFNLILEPCPTIESMQQMELNPMNQDTGMYIPIQNSDMNDEVTKSNESDQIVSPTYEPNEDCKHVSIVDLQCAACKQLLFHPVVLNCGHVYCQTCIIDRVEEMLRCQECQILHPTGFPKVCLEFDHFLEEQFPKEYALRRNALQLKRQPIKNENQNSCSTKASKSCSLLHSNTGEQNVQSCADPQSKVHVGVGCDSCGMCPIVGDRYRCKDCVEKIGFDLCGDCYNTQSKLPGRFNQQHTPEHKFELVAHNRSRNIFLRLVAGYFEDLTTLTSFDDASEISENEFLAPILSGDPSEGTENSSPRGTNPEGAEDQNWSESIS
ncbi:hypothetical protein K2173_017295 [Erythroxylum novogranatense]|uniref:E3 ubiquitin-protein ligase PRT1 n=1 Tax=Erythroxylum novogranatense TaxID=1862640 RepID=A0AAV8UCJ6_9ROSI|nr:hypothetical protein K2173_017295 [Erythroxylum novogranatense]